MGLGDVYGLWVYQSKYRGQPSSDRAFGFNCGRFASGGGSGLIYGEVKENRRLGAQKQRLRQQTLESEILRMATETQGKITLLEVMRDLAIDQPLAEQTLDALLNKGILDLEITDSGVLVYTVYDLQKLEEKSTSKRIHDV